MLFTNIKYFKIVFVYVIMSVKILYAFLFPQKYFYFCKDKNFSVLAISTTLFSCCWKVWHCKGKKIKNHKKINSTTSILAFYVGNLEKILS